MAKISQFNYFQPSDDGNYIAFNARSGAIAVMTGENYKVYQKICHALEKTPNPDLGPDEIELFEQLGYGEFIIQDNFNELEHLEFEHMMHRYDQTTLGLIIAPTLACNMGCKYCYESNKKGMMSTETIEAILQFIEDRARNLDLVDIAWYGGEPLLALDIIEDVTESILDLAREYKFRYSSSMITNGYKLTPDTVDRLRGLKVSMVQVTLDGPREMHNKSRPLKNGKDSYDTIIENITYASKKMIIGLRINIDKTFNSDKIGLLLDDLEKAGLQKRIGIYFGLLEPWTTVCSSISENCLSNFEFSQVELEYFRLLLERGFRVEKLPTPKIIPCMAQDINSFLIDPEGELYRCYNHVGNPEKTMGNIKNDINYKHENFMRTFRFNPFNDDTCRTCKILPVCVGGCPSRRNDRKLSGNDLCDTWKHNLPQMLEIIAKSRQQLAASQIKES